MAAARITRHFASIPGGRWGPRQVHYRRTGRGPVLILLHQSPLSSRDVIATMQRWQRHYTCIAPDTPGYGLSDPLGVTHAEMDDFATAVVEFLDAIGVDKAAFYGFHTGAMMAAMLAARYPQRVHAVVANGYVIPTTAERAELVAEYLPPFVPTWDGAHLAWLWSRMREQVIFFPWYRKEPADRMALTLPPPEVLQANLVEFLRAGDHYRVAYRAAFTMPAAEALAGLRVPLLVTAAAGDPLQAHGQQISLAAATSVRRRLIEAAGIRHSQGLLCHPDAARLARMGRAALRGAGLSQAKAAAVSALSEATADGSLPLAGWTDAPPVAEIRARLAAIRGIGPWTVEYTLLRGFGHLDGSLAGDVAVRRKLQRLLGREDRISAGEAARWLAEFTPWRALVAAHLWAWRAAQPL